MRTVRRLYFYAVAVISLEVVLWGLIGLLRSMVSEALVGTVDALAQALALIFVGVPIFLFHWVWTQRAAARDEEERSATLRAVFLYGVLLLTFIPVAQNVLALINRLLLAGAALSPFRAVVGGQQTWQDNLIAIALNGGAAAYFLSALRADWRGLSERSNFLDVRRLYRYIWVLYSLALTVLGVQKVLRFMFHLPSGVLGDFGRDLLLNGIALTLVGAPLWVYAWRTCQRALSQPEEQGSLLRLGVMYLLSIAGVVTVLTSTGIVLDVLLRLALGEGMLLRDVLQEIGGAVSTGIPLAGLWVYYGHWLGSDIGAVSEESRRAALKRVYYYILAVIGLGAAFIGTALLLSFVIDLLTTAALWGLTMRARLASALATLAAGLPLWLATWRPMEGEALASGDLGDHARRSVVRKVYIYLVLFAAVIGGMTSAVGLVFQLLRALLSGEVSSNFLSNVLDLTQLLFLFVVLLVYHLSILRRDGVFAAEALAARRRQFPVLVLTAESPFGETVHAALTRHAPGIPVTIGSASEKPKGEFRAVILPGSLAVDAPAWMRSFRGSRIIVPEEAQGVFWAGGVSRQAVTQAVQIVRQLAEGQEVRQSVSGAPGWMVVVYILATLFALQLLFMLLALIGSAL